MAKIKFLTEFRSFIERGSAIDMAVGIITGGVMTSLVNSLVKDVIMPPIGLLIGGIDFSQYFFVLSGGQPGVTYNTIAEAQAAGAATMNIGLFLNSVVSFLITMWAIFWIVRLVGKMRSKKPVVTRQCPYCMSSINVSATKCPNCCSAVKPVEATPAEDSEVRKSIKEFKQEARKKIEKYKAKTKR